MAVKKLVTIGISMSNEIKQTEGAKGYCWVNRHPIFRGIVPLFIKVSRCPDKDKMGRQIVPFSTVLFCLKLIQIFRNGVQAEV
jgi:hypothetical protein